MVAPAFPCDGCGSPVEDQDLETGSAITLLGKTYCPACKVGATKSVTLRDLVAQAPPPPRPPGTPRAPRAARSEEAPTILSALPRRRPTIPAGAAKKPWIAVGILFAVALLGALALKAVSGGGGEKIEPPADDPDPAPIVPVSAEEARLARARKAFLAVETIAQRPDAVFPEVLTALDKARSECKGTPSETSLETLRNKVLKRAEADEALKELLPLLEDLTKAVAEDTAFARYGELQARFDQARNLAARSDSSRIAAVQELQTGYAARYENTARPFYEEIHEAASTLAGERRYNDALGYIEKFPAHLRHSGAWKSLERLRQDIERQRALQK